MNSTAVSNLTEAIDGFSVPPFDMSHIVRRASGSSSRTQRPRRNIGFALVAAFGLPALALAAVHFMPLGVTNLSGNWQLHGPTRTFMYPSEATFSKIAKPAPYRVLWPAGLPRASAPIALGETGSEVFTVFYRCPRGDAYFPGVWAIIIPKHFNQINPELGKWFASQMALHHRNLLWDAGDESVLLSTDCLTTAQMNAVRAATH